VRLAVIGAAVGTALVIPGLAGAGDPRLLFELRPPETLVLENGGRRDALLTIDVHNPGDRRVRVDRLRLTYLEGETVVGTLDPAASLFTAAGYVSDPSVDPGQRDQWVGLCLAPPTSATDRVRFEMTLVERQRARKVRATQILEVPLRAPLDPPRIAFPFSGTWRVTQGHTCDTNHRRGRLGGEFSWDFAAINEAGRSGVPGFEKSHHNDDSATFGRPVTSPVQGTILTAVNGVEDNDGLKEFPRRSLVESVRAPKWIFGNYVVVDAGEGIYVLLAHLKRTRSRSSRGMWSAWATSSRARATAATPCFRTSTCR
jgi:murein DD-endopeptidase MepM/ murein hydrolase activator NlpD